jgi:transcriptional regulator with XRE-family HTH domain
VVATLTRSPVASCSGSTHRQLGMKQPAIARLESGDHNPSIETLWKLASGLGIEFHIDVTPKGLAV